VLIYVCLNRETYIANDDDIVNVLLFAVKRRRRDHFELADSKLNQSEHGGGHVVEPAADAGVGGAVAVADGNVGDEAASVDVLRNPRMTTVTVVLGGFQRVGDYHWSVIVDIQNVVRKTVRQSKLSAGTMKRSGVVEGSGQSGTSTKKPCTTSIQRGHLMGRHSGEDHE